MSAKPLPPPWLLWWLTLIIGGVCFFSGLGDIPLLAQNEARRALPAQAMFATGDWLLPRLNGQLYLAKPPLLYWLATIASHFFGAVSEWSTRLPSALAAAAITLAACRYALSRYGPWAALFTAQALIANTSFAMFARRAEIEMLLTALCCGALLAVLRFIEDQQAGRRWILLSYVLLGLAILAKGPLALLFVTLPLLVHALIYRQARAWQALRDPAGWGLLLLVGGSWFLAVSLELGFDIWQATVQRDMLNKIHGVTAAPEPLFSYVLWLLADFFPASLLLLAAPLATGRRWKDNHRLAALLIAVAVPLLIFSAFSDKHAKYLLPLYPLLALLAGKRLSELMTTARPVWQRLLPALGLLMPLGYASFYTVAEARVFDYRYTGLMQFEQWIASAGETPVYGYLSLDERALYYARRTIPMLNPAEIEQKRAQQSALLLLVDNNHLDAIAPQADCTLRQFTPYLKRHKTLTVLGFGNVCQPAAGKASGSFVD
ncbi:MAG: glycosyltransferase family 39 protein [Azonexus sp.]|jgi:4-amino-4-deoxy-L-arabinose transferase-like glycosyltransferase|nr:glycosyltransferase family 39 protein [Azonexus sp.]